MSSDSVNRTPNAQMRQAWNLICELDYIALQGAGAASLASPRGKDAM
jgi:hypothetical protein